MVWPIPRRPSRRVSPLVVADVALDVETGWLSVGGWTVRLTSREVQLLLEQLMRQPGRVVGDDELASILQVDASHLARSARRLRRRLMVNPLSPPLRARREQSRGRPGGPSS